MRRLIAVTACLAMAGLAAPAVAGETGLVSPPQIFERNLDDVKTESGIDVYLPSHLRVFIAPRRVRGSASSDDGTYSLDLGVGRSCNGANACYVANFTGTRGQEPALGRRVRLRGGRTGFWKGITCGGSCSPAEIQWVQDDVLYTIATKSVTLRKEKATLVKLANNAIGKGPR